MTLRWSLAAALVLLLAAAVPAAEPDGELRVALEPADLPLAAFTSLIGTYVRTKPDAKAPDGFDGVFDLTLEDGRADRPLPVQVLHRGWTGDDLKLFLSVGGRDAEEIARCDGRIYPYYVAFGPVGLPGRPACTLHFFVPPDERKAAAPRAGILYLVPAGCLKGQATIGGRTLTVGLLDINLNGDFGDACVKHARDGDWLLVDEDGDGAFRVGYRLAESKSLTRIVSLGGQTFSARLDGRTLVLSPASVECFKIRLEGLVAPCTVSGWSTATGDVSGTLDADGCIEVPRGGVGLFSYQVVKDGWRVTANLRALGTIEPPDSGDTRTVAVGPGFRLSLAHRPRGLDHHFTFQCLGRGGESVTLFDGKTRVAPPELVVTLPGGVEVERLAMKYG